MQNDAVPIQEALSNLGMNVANVLAKAITNQSEQWYFITNMYDQLLTQIPEKNWLQVFPFKLFEIEYRWGKIEPFVFEVRGNPGLDYINKQVVPSLLETFDADLVNLTIAHAYSQYCIHYVAYIQDTRRVFAEHFRENFRRDGHNAIADRWDEVARSLRS
ncbi:hypothetical protein HFN65_31460 [Rhizobium laguerreae]|uniref:hypothetical protein n=1 Tax=Rhizobium TaxID=379 RepID=UPI00102FA5D6|nr:MULTISPECIES: hypothetical protein [Rhizobium]MBA1343905.1 hypothetical protein [Rhizobium sp. WYCCWR 11146]MBY3575458.1 hypothetical protein [Rhizobium laguerreae]TBF89160.1 hypothetical protein ELG82_37075 [Rhizobium leguminosarum]